MVSLITDIQVHEKYRQERDIFQQLKYLSTGTVI